MELSFKSSGQLDQLRWFTLAWMHVHWISIRPDPTRKVLLLDQPSIDVSLTERLNPFDVGHYMAGRD